MIVFPMAGLSRRFRDAGYERPKYMLEAHGRTLFRHAVEGFGRYFSRLPFLFVGRDIDDTGAFVDAECRRMGLRDHRTILLPSPTRGQAETVAKGIVAAGVDGDSALTVFNIDTFRPDFSFPDDLDTQACDGFLEVFRGQGANWSFVRAARQGDGEPPPPRQQVIETAEKKQISNLSCTGLYHFRRVKDFMWACRGASRMHAHELVNGELFVAPLYNPLIAAGADIRFHEVAREAVTFCGVPEEYRAFLAADGPPPLGGPHGGGP